MIPLIISIAYLSGLTIYISKELYQEYHKDSILNQVIKVKDTSILDDRFN